jgi:acetyl-CoA carboxylase biotin carboxylase subunit
VFTRILIANRGEVAVRIIRACHELGIEAVAVYSTADSDSLHVRLADRAVHIGPPPPAGSYLNIPSLIAAGTTTDCEAVHPGWGFLAENAAFAAACEDNDLVFIGPRPETIETMGDKVAAKAAVAGAGLPLVPGSEGAVSLADAAALASDVGFPVLLKAPRRGSRGPPGSLQNRELGGSGGLRGRLALRGEGDRRRTPRRDPSAGRRRRGRPHTRRA